MGIENSCNFIGRLGDDPVIRSTGGEKPVPVANFVIAVNEKYGKKETTQWVNLVAFNGLATVVQKYTKKGSKIAVRGRMQNRKWEGTDGETRYQTEFVLDSLHLADSKGSGGGNRELPPVDEEPPMGAIQPDIPAPSDEDIPF